MNYRHAYHAGNFADVFKHAILARILVYLAQKPGPLRFVDTHAGIGRYDLSSAEAQKTGEWRGGVGRLPMLAQGVARDLLQPWLDCLGPLDDAGCPAMYPGSPAVAQALLRPQDSLRLCELHVDDADTLDIQLGGDRRVKILMQDGYAALNGLVPPPERRGLVLIDPPFEVSDEFARLTRAILAAHRKWREGTYLAWYPLKDGIGRNFGEPLAQAGLRRILRLTLDIGANSSAPGALTACGLLIINPPYVLEAEARIILPALERVLRAGLGGGFTVERLAGE